MTASVCGPHRRGSGLGVDDHLPRRLERLVELDDGLVEHEERPARALRRRLLLLDGRVAAGQPSVTTVAVLEGTGTVHRGTAEGCEG